MVNYHVNTSSCSKRGVICLAMGYSVPVLFSASTSLSLVCFPDHVVLFFVSPDTYSPDFEISANPFPKAGPTMPCSCVPNNCRIIPLDHARRPLSHPYHSNKDMLSISGNSSCPSDSLMYLSERKPEGGKAPLNYSCCKV